MTQSNAVPGFVPSLHGLHFSNRFPPGPTLRLGVLDPRLVGIGDASAGLLASDGHAGITYHATGPVSLTPEAVASAVGAAFGKTIAYTALTDEQVRANLAAAGLPEPMADVLARFQNASAAGLFDVVTHDVERLSGRAAQSAVDFIVAALKAQGAPA